jgi:hypothetical protein
MPSALLNVSMRERVAPLPLHRFTGAACIFGIMPRFVASSARFLAGRPLWLSTRSFRIQLKQPALPLRLGSRANGTKAHAAPSITQLKQEVTAKPRPTAASVRCKPLADILLLLLGFLTSAAYCCCSKAAFRCSLFAAVLLLLARCVTAHPI